MHILNFIVKNQIIHYCSTRPLVACSKGHVYAQFKFDDEWTGLNIIAVFKNSSLSEPHSVLLTDTNIEVPVEVLVEGHLSVSLEGVASQGDIRIPTASMAMPIKVYRSGDPAGMLTEKVSPEIWEQILAAMGAVSSLDTADKSSLVAAINETLMLANSCGGNGIYFGPGEIPDGFKEQIVPSEKEHNIKTEFFSQAEKDRIIQEVIESIIGNIYGVVDVENNIIPSEKLPAGTHTVRYILSDGTVVGIGQITVGT